MLFARVRPVCTAQPDQPGPGDGQGEGNRHTSGKYADPVATYQGKGEGGMRKADPAQGRLKVGINQMAPEQAMGQAGKPVSIKAGGFTPLAR